MLVHFSSLQDKYIFVLREDMVSKRVDYLKSSALFALDQPKLSFIVRIDRTYFDEISFVSNRLIGRLQGVVSLFV